MHAFNRLRLRVKALIAPLLFLIAGAGLTASAVQSYSTHLMEQRKDTLRAVVATVEAVTQHFAEAAVSGDMALETAKRAARDAISRIRFGKGDYVVVIGSDATLLVYPNAQLVGLPNEDLPSGIGAMVRAQVEKTRQTGPTFGQVRVNRPGETALLSKLSYSAPLGEWGWFVATGLYLDDIEADVWSYGERLSAITLITVALTGVLSWLAMAEFDAALRRVMAAMRQIAEGNTAVTIPSQIRRDEVGSVAKTLETLRGNLAAAATMREEAATARETAEAAKQAAEIDRAKQAAAQAGVVKSLAGALSRLAEGDLTCLIEEEFTVDYEGLRKDFNAALGELRLALASVVDNTRGIRCGAAEISRAADDLSRRTEQQAATLEETAAALDQITATVQKTAEQAVAARSVVAAAQREAAQGEDIVRDAVTAIAAVEASSQKITSIIGVMDEIAFQTNLLALNAGVEAARAGDSGRGFAVVASEVRALAQRSAAAATEIKGLIGASTGQVGHGVTLVRESGAALGRIRAQVIDIDKVVSEITASTREQAGALAEVNTAVNQIDQVTQQNAAMVEQSTAASRTVADDTRKLEAMTGRFKVVAT